MKRSSVNQISLSNQSPTSSSKASLREALPQAHKISLPQIGSLKQLHKQSEPHASPTFIVSRSSNHRLSISKRKNSSVELKQNEIKNNNSAELYGISEIENDYEKEGKAVDLNLSALSSKQINLNSRNLNPSSVNSVASIKNYDMSPHNEALFADIQKKIMLGKAVKHSVNKGIMQSKQSNLLQRQSQKPQIVYDEYTKSYKILQNSYILNEQPPIKSRNIIDSSKSSMLPSIGRSKNNLDYSDNLQFQSYNKN